MATPMADKRVDDNCLGGDLCAQCTENLRGGNSPLADCRKARWFEPNFGNLDGMASLLGVSVAAGGDVNFVTIIKAAPLGKA